MHYLKRNAKLGMLAFLVPLLFLTISISTLAKTEVYPACACLHLSACGYAQAGADRFSLSDNPQKEIIKNINQAQASINIAMYIFTDREIALPLAKAQPLLTGSYNWTFSANNRNDENLMIIDDPEIIEIFQNQFINLWTNKYSPERTRQLYEIAKVNLFSVFPPPVQTGTKVININTALRDELIKILQISQLLVRKITDLPFMSFPRMRESIPPSLRGAKRRGNLYFLN